MAHQISNIGGILTGGTGNMIPCGDGYFQIAPAPHSTLGVTTPDLTSLTALPLVSSGQIVSGGQINLASDYSDGSGAFVVQNNDRAKPKERTVKEPKEPTIGSVVWSKATGEGPYVVVSETVTEVEEDSKIKTHKRMHQIQAMLVRDGSGRFRTMPTGDLTTVKSKAGKPSGYSWVTKVCFLLIGMALGGVLLVAGVVALIVAAVNALL